MTARKGFSLLLAVAVKIALRCADIGMTQEIAKVFEIAAVLKVTSGKGVSESMQAAKTEGGPNERPAHGDVEATAIFSAVQTAEYVSAENAALHLLNA